MKMIYLSHPFSGNEEENRNLARNKLAKIAKQFPDTLFVNPLDNFTYAEVAKLDYQTILKLCLELLVKCDGIILLEGWEDSVGCRKEYKFALEKGLPVYDENLTVIEF